MSPRLPKKSFFQGYINPYCPKSRRGFFHFLLWQLGKYKDPAPLPPPPADFHFPQSPVPVDEKASWVKWLQHSTYLVKADQWNLLTDPIWSERCSPLPFLGPKRVIQPPLTMEELPPIHFVMISHNHYDHLDVPTITQLCRHSPIATWILPWGLKRWFVKKFPQIPQQQVQQLRWWETYGAGKISFTAVPSQHFSGRGAFDYNRTLWMGVVVCLSMNDAKTKQIYFAGDTGYNSHQFKEIGQQFTKMDLSLLPIGTYCPRAFMKPVHLDPREAIEIHKDVGSKLSLGGHWGTFRLSEEPLNRPPYDLYLALQECQIPWETFRVLPPGQALNW